MKTVWLKNLRTGIDWELDEAQAADKLRETDDEGMVYEQTSAPSPGPKPKKNGSTGNSGGSADSNGNGSEGQGGEQS